MPSELNPRDLTKITVNRETVQALTLASAEIRISIGPGGTTAQIHESGSGKLLGGMDDLTKLLGLRTFVAKEKKQFASNDMRDEALKLAYRASAHIQAEGDKDFTSKVLDNSYVVAIRPYKSLVETLRKRKVVVEQNRNTDSGLYKGLIIAYIDRMIGAACQLIIAMVKGESGKGLYEDLLFNAGVPAYIKTKLSANSLAIDELTDLSKLIFTADPGKGFALTLAEWRDESFCKKQGGLLTNSRALGAILRSDDLVRVLTDLDEETFGNKEHPRTQRVMKTRIIAIPIREEMDVLVPLSRENSRGWTLPSTSMERPENGLQAVAGVFLCAYCHTLRVAELIPDFYDRIFTPGSIKKPDEKRGNLPAQAIRLLEAGMESTLMESLRGESITNLSEWICRETKMVPNGTLHKKVKGVLSLVEASYADEPDGSLPDGAGAPLTRVASFRAYAIGKEVVPFSFSAEMRASELEGYEIFKKSYFLFRERELKKQRTTAASSLARGTRTFLKRIREKYSSELSASMEAYFRSFLSQELQLVGVELAEGRFDEMDELSDLGSSEEEDSSDDED